MFKIDELIENICKNEAIDIPGEINPAQQKRIENLVREKIETTDRIRYFRKRKHRILLLAATLILTLGLTVFAATENEWDIRLIHFMGLNKSEVLQLDGGEVIIREKVSSNWRDYRKTPEGEEKTITITEITSIGDQNSAYIRVNTDYELPEKFDETTDYILPEKHSLNITYKNIWGREKMRTFGSSFVGFYENGKLGFLISVENCKNLNKCNVQLKMENLYWYHDLGEHWENETSVPEELLCEGEIETRWTFSYKSNVKTKHLFKKIESEEGEYYITKIQISPISIRIEAIRNPKDRKKAWAGNMLEKICYKDETIIEIQSSSGGGVLNGIFIDEFIKTEEIGRILNPEEIKYLILDGENVDM